MPHESTVDPEDPMRFKSWGEEYNHTDHLDRRRSTLSQLTTSHAPQLNHSLSIQTHPDLPLHVTHDHDNDGDPDDESPNESISNENDEFDLRTRITYTPPKRQVQRGFLHQHSEENE